nr:uncharacterized protein LOC126529950 [Dermacentor andersoni]
MDPAWEVAVFRRQNRPAKDLPRKVTVSGNPSDTRRWWSHELPWIVVALATVLVLLVLTLYSLMPTRSARFIVLTGDDWRRNPSAMSAWQQKDHRTADANLS